MNCEKCSETLPIFVSLEGNESTCDIVIVKDVSPASFNKIMIYMNIKMAVRNCYLINLQKLYQFEVLTTEIYNLELF